MQIEIEQPKSRRKNHKKTPVDLLPIQEKNAGAMVKAEDLDPELVIDLFERFATDPEVDLYTICDVLNISRRQLNKLQKSEEFQDKYEEALERRGHKLASMGLEVAGVPFKKLMKGEQCGKELILAAKTYSNYLLTYGQNCIGNFGRRNKDDQGAVNISINVPPLHHITDAVDAEVTVTMGDTDEKSQSDT